MVLPKVGAPSTTTRKKSKRPTNAPKVEEIPGALASTSQEIFHMDYILPKKDNAPHVKVPIDGKYLMATSPIPPSVSVEGDMLNKVSTLKFVDHDITNAHNFPEMAREKYLCTKSVPST
jgi:hypothetical protein